MLHQLCTVQENQVDFFFFFFSALTVRQNVTAFVTYFVRSQNSEHLSTDKHLPNKLNPPGSDQHKFTDWTHFENLKKKIKLQFTFSILRNMQVKERREYYLGVGGCVQIQLTRGSCAMLRDKLIDWHQIHHNTTMLIETKPGLKTSQLNWE